MRYYYSITLNNLLITSCIIENKKALTRLMMYNQEYFKSI